MKIKDKFKNVSLTALVCAVISAIVGFFIFEMDWPFIPLPLAAGIAIISFIDETRVYKYLDGLFIGSLIYGILAPLLIYSRMYAISNWIYHSGFPFWPTYNPQEFLIMILVFTFICFLGGLVGIVGKGSYCLWRDQKRQLKSPC